MKTNFIGTSPAILKIKELIELVKNTDLNVVISGETGVGKEVVAQSLYNASNRNKNSFIKVNCAALPEGLLESELYGYVPGAFTGADRKKKGKFELAHNGVLFLDEIGDMSLPLQTKLLHVLQNGEFSPLGSERELTTNTWVIAATNCDLEQKVSDKSFRSDLYYRLNIFNIHIPPLRDRKEDIPSLIEYHTNKIINKNLQKEIQPLSRKTIANLTSYHWPGNVRQLENTLLRILLLGSGEDVTDKLLNGEPALNTELNGNEMPVPAPTVTSHAGLDLDAPSFSLKNIRKKALDKVEYDTIAYVLKKTNWNRSKAAIILKISYKTLLSKISDLSIKPDT